MRETILAIVLTLILYGVSAQLSPPYPVTNTSITSTTRALSSSSIASSGNGKCSECTLVVEATLYSTTVETDTETHTTHLRAYITPQVSGTVTVANKTYISTFLQINNTTGKSNVMTLDTLDDNGYRNGSVLVVPYETEAETETPETIFKYTISSYVMTYPTTYALLNEWYITVLPSATTNSICAKTTNAPVQLYWNDLENTPQLIPAPTPPASNANPPLPSVADSLVSSVLQIEWVALTWSHFDVINCDRSTRLYDGVNLLAKRSGPSSGAPQPLPVSRSTASGFDVGPSLIPAVMPDEKVKDQTPIQAPDSTNPDPKPEVGPPEGTSSGTKPEQKQNNPDGQSPSGAEFEVGTVAGTTGSSSTSSTIDLGTGGVVSVEKTADGTLIVDNVPITPGGIAEVNGVQVSNPAPGTAPAGEILVNGTPQQIYEPVTGGVVSVGGETVPIFAQKDGVVIDGTTVGYGQVATINGEVVSVPPTGADGINPSAIVVNGVTQAVVAAAGPSVLTVGGSVITASPNGAFVIDGQTLTPGGVITIGASTISLGPNGVAVINGVTQTAHPVSATPAGILTIACQTFKPTVSNGKTLYSIADKTTLTAGKEPFSTSINQDGKIVLMAARTSVTLGAKSCGVSASSTVSTTTSTTTPIRPVGNAVASGFGVSNTKKGAAATARLELDIGTTVFVIISVLEYVIH